MSLPQIRVGGKSRAYDAAVIGGGITGLTAAFRLSRDRQCSKVTLYEKSSSLGGYIQSETIPVDGGKVVFEHGPRTIRAPADLHSTVLFSDLLNSLKLGSRIDSTPKRSPAAYNRYIYYPDHLVRMPGPVPGGVLKNITELCSRLSDPIFRGVLWSIVSEPFKRRPRVCPDDESVGEFISRRFSKRVADNLASAVFHGIYAGDIYKLSARTLLRPFYEGEAAHGSIIRSQIKRWRSVSKPERTARFLAAVTSLQGLDTLRLYRRIMTQSSVFTFKDGLGELVDALVDALKKSKKVDIITNAEVKDISQDSYTSDLTVSYGQGKCRVHNRVIATNPAPDLARVLSHPPDKNRSLPQDTIASLKTLNYAVSVMVVNLYYSNPNLVPVKGFGYLIPLSTPKSQNPDGGLGVIFASQTSRKQDTAPGTKLTVMLGGHMWDDLTDSDYPDHEFAVTMARSLLQRHLGVTEAPTITRSRLHRSAIPQYTVGHDARLKEISRAVRTEFRQRLTLAGNWYDGVSIPDCITQGHLAAVYGVGRVQLGPVSGFQLDEMEGGIAMPPTPWHWEDKKRAPA